MINVPTSTQQSTHLHIRIAPDMLNGLRDAAKARNRTVSNLVHTAILRFLSEQDGVKFKEPIDCLVNPGKSRQKLIAQASHSTGTPQEHTQ